MTNNNLSKTKYFHYCKLQKFLCGVYNNLIKIKTKKNSVIANIGEFVSEDGETMNYSSPGLLYTVTLSRPDRL